MSTVITLRACLMAASAIAGLILGGCAGPTMEADQPSTPTSATTMRAPVVKAPRLETGTDAGLITTPAPSWDVADEADEAAQQEWTARTATAAATETTATMETPAAQAPAPVAAPLAPVEPTCQPGEEYDPTIPACVAQQLPEEAVGGARCENPDQVVVAILEDGTPVCGAPDDTHTGTGA